MKTTERLMMPYLERVDFERDEQNRRINDRVAAWIENRLIKRELMAERAESELHHRRAMASRKKPAKVALERSI